MHTKKSAELNWMSTKWTNKWGTVQMGRDLFYCTTKWMTWHPHFIPQWSDTYWKFNLYCFLSYEMNRFQYGFKPGFWLYFMLFTINIRFHLYLNERAILTSWQYGCTSSMEPRDIWNNMRAVVCSIGFQIRKFKLRIWLKFSANSRFK